MTKKADIDFANASVPELKIYLDKLKKYEAKLEIALTLRKYPEIELTLIRITTLTVELANLEKLMKLEVAGTPEEEIAAQKKLIDGQIEALKRRLVGLIGTSDEVIKLRNTYSNRVKELTASLDTVGLNRKVLKYRENYLNLLIQLQKLYVDFMATVKMPEDFNFFYEVPKLEYFINRAKQEELAKEKV